MNSRTGDKQIIRSLDELSQATTPTRDLWPGISAQLAPRRRPWAVPASLVAAVLLAAVGVLVGMQLRQTQSPTIQPGSGALVRTALMSDRVYESRRRELLDALPAKLDRLPPASRERVLESLTAVQTAMRSLEKELGRDGSNALLQELLIGACQEEMRVLTAVDAIGATEQEI